ncbi:hemagglutinin [Peredibacter sp. HCB2-198]|uniref:hemagglutinin n=1 Tax=Peredibacter sp. HCB2-198 TaxID=3383025 RepID=UPI0038B60728
MIEVNGVDEKADIKVEYQGIENVVPSALITNYPVKGSCPSIKSNIDITLAGNSQSVPCTSKRFEAFFNLSAESDGPLEVTLKAQSGDKQISKSVTLIKDTQAPLGTLSTSGMGASLSGDSSPRMLTVSSVDTDFFQLKRKVITSGVCAGQDFSSSPVEYLSPLPMATTVTPNASNKVCLIGGDKAGNWSSAVFESAQIFVDTLAPQLSFSPSSFDGASSTSKMISWYVTEKNPSATEQMILEFSQDGSTGWTVLDQRIVGPGELSNQNYTYNWSIPNITTGNGKLRLTLKDGAGLERIILSNAVIDNLAPTLNSMVLANGADNIGLPSVPVLLSVTPSLSRITEMRLSEDSGFAGASWIPYSAGQFSFALSQIAGPKTVYAQVRSAAGFESNVVSDSATLDFGSPPDIKILTPENTMTYAPGANMTISWECTSASSAGLATVPIKRIDYTADDGINYFPIATELTNNLGPTTGSYVWSVPSVTPNGQTITVTTPLRINVTCASAAGVVSSGASQILNSAWKIIAGEPGNIDNNVHANAASFSHYALHGDSNNILYYTRKHALMKIDPVTGLVSRWLGSIENRGCDLASGDVGSLDTPEILDITNDEMLIYSAFCQKLFKVRISDKALLWSRPILMTMHRTYVKTGHLIYYYDYGIYLLDLNSITSTSQRLIGTPGSCGTLGAIDSDASLSPLTCPTIDVYYPVITPDLNKVWIIFKGTDFIQLEKDTGGVYRIKPSTLNVATPVVRCVHTSFDDTKFYCKATTPGNTSRLINYFDFVNGTVSPSYGLNTYALSTSNQLHIGAGVNSVYVLSTTNEVFEIKLISNSFQQQKIAGKAFHSYGNGTDVTKTAFTDISSFVYDDVFNYIYVRGAQHIRRLHVDDTDPLDPKIDRVETALNSTHIPNSIPNFGLAVSINGQVLANTKQSGTSLTWMGVDLTTWNAGAETVGAWTTNFYWTPSGPSTYPALGESFTNPSTHALNRTVTNSMGTFVPNGKFYFPATRDILETQDLWIFESDGPNVKSVAGADGSIGYESGSHGQLALGQRLTRINGIQTDTNGDLLIFDSSRLRRISVTTESIAPKIYNEIDFTTFTGYPGDLKWSHAYYDESTGWSYFAIHENQATGQAAKIYAARQAEGFEEIPLDGLLIRGVRERDIFLQKSPLGLMLLDTNKKRILGTSLKSP